MSVKSSYPTERPARVQYAALAAAAMLIVMLVAQLFSYEDFPATLAPVLITNDQSLVFVLSAVIVSTELFALPFLLAMKLSKLMRTITATFALAVALFWFFTTLTNAHITNVGLLGSTVAVPGGLLAVTWSGLLLGLVVYVLQWTIRDRSTNT